MELSCFISMLQIYVIFLFFLFYPTLINYVYTYIHHTLYKHISISTYLHYIYIYFNISISLSLSLYIHFFFISRLLPRSCAADQPTSHKRPRKSPHSQRLFQQICSALTCAVPRHISLDSSSWVDFLLLTYFSILLLF